MRKCKLVALRQVLLVLYSGGTQLDTEGEGTLLLLKVGVQNQRHGLTYHKNWIFSKRNSSLAWPLTAELDTCERNEMDAEFWSVTVNVRRYSETRHMWQNGIQIWRWSVVSVWVWIHLAHDIFSGEHFWTRWCSSCIAILGPFSDQPSNISLTKRPVLHWVRSTQFHYTWTFHTVWRRNNVLANNIYCLWAEF
jgi:hypothetical protein